MVDEEQGECKTENTVNEKSGRKVLFVGGPCKPGPVPDRQPAAHEEQVIRRVEGVIFSGIRGDYSGRIDEGTVIDTWKPLVKAVNESKSENGRGEGRIFTPVKNQGKYP